MANLTDAPGVYYQPAPRTPEAPAIRTDVAGFIGFEPRVRDGSTPSTLIGSPPIGHAFRVDVAGFAVTVGTRLGAVPATTDFVLSADAASIPIGDGESILYALVAVGGQGPAVSLFALAGTPGSLVAPSNDDVTAAVTGAFGGRRPWTRLCDVEVRRAGDAVFPTVVPALPPTRCEDWRDFLLAFGPRTDDGTMLAASVRAFFANGGRRCHVATVRRPRPDDGAGLEEARQAMVGIDDPTAGEREATGLARLTLIDEVAIVDVPDLYARRTAPTISVLPLPPPDTAACFGDCSALGPPVVVEARGFTDDASPLYDDAAVLDVQRRMLVRLAREPWRAVLLLTPPWELDPIDGRFHGPTSVKAEAWRAALDGTADDIGQSCAALYFPWLLAQERVDAPVEELPPTGFVAGIIARRDVTRGAHVAPANETLVGAVGLGRPIDDVLNGRLYAPPININVLRAFPGFGIQLWGARTLSRDTFLRYLPVRRALQSVERRVASALQLVVFEPHTQMLWLQAVQIVLNVLLPLFNEGGLRGDRPDQAFFVRCDSSNNPPEAIAGGQLLIEVGVAIAAPAEFIVFRVGRRDGVVEVVE
jgi:hypothetical protein